MIEELGFRQASQIAERNVRKNILVAIGKAILRGMLF